MIRAVAARRDELAGIIVTFQRDEDGARFLRWIGRYELEYTSPPEDALRRAARDAVAAFRAVPQSTSPF